MTDSPAAGNAASGIPEEAVTAAKISDNKYNRERTMPNIGDDRIRNFLRAAAPHLLAAEVSAHRAEQDAVHADLSQLLRVLRMSDHARPQSSHEVMLDAISEVSRMRVALDGAAAVIGGRDSALARARSLLDAAILIGGERYVRADYIREALEGDRD